MILYDEKQKQENDNAGILERVEERYREKFAAMMEAEEDEKYEDMLQQGEQLLEEGCEELILYLCVSRAYMKLDDPEKALEIVKKVHDPEDVNIMLQEAVCYQMMGENDKTEEVLRKFYPLETYMPFFYTTYANALAQLDKYKKAREVYDVVVRQFENGYNPGSQLLDGVFQQVIELDMIADIDTLDEDIEEYQEFLSGLEGNKREQDNAARNLPVFACYNSNAKYRKVFLGLLNFLTDKKFFTDRVNIRILNSGYVSVESYLIQGDDKISDFMKDLLMTASSVGTKEDREIDEELWQTPYEKDNLKSMERECALRKYCCHLRTPRIFDEFTYIENTYPYTYEYVKDFVSELQTNVDAAKEKYLEEALRLDEFDGLTKEQNRKLYDRFYKENYEGGKMVWDSTQNDTYRRTGAKVGRNDPCPCGSGKKYKKCCGK